jgi:hypothetical protein
MFSFILKWLKHIQLYLQKRCFKNKLVAALFVVHFKNNNLFMKVSVPGTGY